MLRIACPYCGIRDETEFSFGGTSHISRPSLEASDEEMASYLFHRENPKGLHYERWLHAYGCERWFNVARNTLTHEILAVYRMGDPRPALQEVRS